MRALVLVALVACAPGIASSAHVNRSLGPVIVEGTQAILVKTDTVEGVVIVRASQPRVCSRAVYDDYVDQRPGALLDEPTRSERRVQIATRRRPCPRPAARVPLDITLPSGQMLRGTTDRAGMFALVLPDGEDALAVRITAGAMPPPLERPRQPVAPVSPPAPVSPQSVEAVRPLGQGMAGVRDVVLRCGRAFGVTGTARLRLTVKAARVTAVVEHLREDFVQCVATEVGNVRFPPATSLETTIAFLVAKP